MAKANCNAVSLAGEFAVLSPQLALRGYDANMTLDPHNLRMRKLEVKTNHRRRLQRSTVSQLMGERREMGDAWEVCLARAVGEWTTAYEGRLRHLASKAGDPPRGERAHASLQISATDTLKANVPRSVRSRDWLDCDPRRD
jgi:hypothetical protein